MTPAQREFSERYGPYFTLQEFACKCHDHPEGPFCDPDDLEWMRSAEFDSFMRKLILMRQELGFPFLINSGYRCPQYNDQIYIDRGSDPGEHLDGPHTKGAADVAASYERAYQLINLALGLDLGVGTRQHGDPARRYVHVDNLGRRLWTYA